MTYFIFNVNEFQIISEALISCDGLFHFPMSYSTMICSYIQAEWFCNFALIHTLSTYKHKLLKGSSIIRKHKRKHESRQTCSKKCVQQAYRDKCLGKCFKTTSDISDHPQRDGSFPTHYFLTNDLWLYGNFQPHDQNSDPKVADSPLVPHTEKWTYVNTKEGWRHFSRRIKELPSFFVFSFFHLAAWTELKIDLNLFPPFIDLSFQLSDFIHVQLLLLCLARPYISQHLSLPIFIVDLPRLCCLVLSLFFFAFNFLPPLTLPLSSPSLSYPPVFSLVRGGSWEQGSTIAEASIFGHADGTEGWGSHTILLQIPSHSSLSSIPLSLLPSLFCAIILVQGVPHSLPLLRPFLFLCTTSLIF